MYICSTISHLGRFVKRFGLSVKESVELSHHAERIGADYLAVGNPYFMANDESQIYDYFRYISDRIIVSHPDERNWYRLMVEFGVRVYMSSASPFLIQKPGRTLIRDYTALVLAGQVEEAARVAASLDPAREVFEKWLREPWPRRRLMPIAYLKAWSELLGMVGGPARVPLPQITPAEREELCEDLVRVGLF